VSNELAAIRVLERRSALPSRREALAGSPPARRGCGGKKGNNSVVWSQRSDCPISRADRRFRSELFGQKDAAVRWGWSSAILADPLASI
jgi:hypothetical protein